MRLTTTIAAIAAALVPAVAMADRTVEPLVDAATLAEVLDREPVVIDIRSVADYQAGHLPTAVSVPYHAWRGPEDNPGQTIPNEKLTLLLSEAGVDRDSTVVVTHAGRDTTDFGAAARVYWTVKSAGVEDVAILNGGVAGWVEDGFELSKDEWSNFPSDESFTLGARFLATTGDVADVIAGRGDAVLIDARPESFFTGREKHDAAAWAGTLAGAIGLEHAGWFGEGARRFEADPATIRAAARQAGWSEGTPIVSFCNTGHWAATNWFALSEIAGLPDVSLYAESMVGWTTAFTKVASN